jgi:hypothetical protein
MRLRLYLRNVALMGITDFLRLRMRLRLYLRNVALLGITDFWNGGWSMFGRVGGNEWHMVRNDA